MRTTASSMPSGRSCAWRIITAGKPRMEDSSVSVPLSDSVQSAFVCSLT